MEVFLPISYLNDFIFCPYSIYLHQVFDNGTEDNFTALPQQRGKNAHVHIDFPSEQKRNNCIKSIYVISKSLGVYGKIDSYYPKEFTLVESKYEIKEIYKGYLFQIWAQYFSLIEMGYKVECLNFYDIKSKKRIPLDLPGLKESEELKSHIRKIARVDFDMDFKVNIQKCKHCIYSSLCDKTQVEHVYS